MPSPPPARVRGTLLVAAFVVATAVILAAAAPLTRRVPGHAGQALVGLVTSAATFLLTLIVLRADRVRLTDIGAALAPGSAARLAAGFIAGSILAAVQVSLTRLAGHVQWTRTADVPLSAAPIAVAGYLLLSCREELAFRGYPLRRLASLYNAVAAQLAVALVFALEHVLGGYDWTNALLGVAIGSLLFGMAALTTRGLAAPIGIHAGWNVGQWVVGGRDVAGYWQPVVEPGFQAHVARAGLTSYVVVMLVAIAACWRLGAWMRLIDSAAPRPADP